LAVQQLLLANALVPVDLSLHGLLGDATHSGPRTAARVTAASARRPSRAHRPPPAVMRCFSHPAASTVAGQPPVSYKADDSTGTISGGASSNPPYPQPMCRLLLSVKRPAQ
jgi:hypothetical protein